MGSWGQPGGRHGTGGGRPAGGEYAQFCQLVLQADQLGSDDADARCNRMVAKELVSQKYHGFKPTFAFAPSTRQISMQNVAISIMTM